MLLSYEVPQNRERVIVIGSKQKINLPKKVNRKVTAGQALGELAFQFDEDSKFLQNLWTDMWQTMKKHQNVLIQEICIWIDLQEL
jgi:site-specific DNA-cytosine methylase